MELGEHNVSIIFRDYYGKSSTHEMLVIVKDSIPPMLSSPADIIFTEGSTGLKIINWSVVDDFNGTYEVYRNGMISATGSWIGSDSINVDLSNLNAGIYTFTLNVIDYSGNTNSDTVRVEVLNDSTTTTTSSTPSSSTESSSSSPESSGSNTLNSSTTSTTTVQISPGFEYAFVLLMLFVNLSIIRYRRLKK